MGGVFCRIHAKKRRCDYFESGNLQQKCMRDGGQLPPRAKDPGAPPCSCRARTLQQKVIFIEWMSRSELLAGDDASVLE
jgi:hypothetical protein